MVIRAILLGLAVSACAPSAPSSQIVRIPLSADAATITLEGVIYRPDTPSPHPIAIFSHGSAGGDPKVSQPAKAQADFLADRGFIVVVPMRRGRGSSEGVSLEGEDKNCDVTSWEPGLRAAYDDLTAAIDFAAALPEADASRVLLAGVSRGGFLSVAYAAEGARRDAVIGVINFSGGWVAQAEDNCPDDFNLLGFERFGPQTRAPQLWLYGEGDPFYSRASILSYAEAFQKGGRARFETVGNVPGNGHQLAAHPRLWQAAADAYIASLPTR